MTLHEAISKISGRLGRMEIKVRNLDKNVVAAIDDLANAAGKSRNQFLQEQLELIARAPVLRQQEEKYEALLREMAAALERNTAFFMQIAEGEENDHE